MSKQGLMQRAFLARRLLANGVPLAINRDDEDHGLLIRQIGGVIESCTFDLRDGRAAYMLSLSITITQAGFAIAAIRLEPPWSDDGIFLIEDPLVSGAPYGNYWFPGEKCLSFERKAVINHIANVQCQLPRGKTFEGLLLWVGSVPIPDEFARGVSLPASVVVLDQYDNSYPHEVSLFVDRSNRKAHDKQKGILNAIGNRSGLP